MINFQTKNELEPQLISVQMTNRFTLKAFKTMEPKGLPACVQAISENLLSFLTKSRRNKNALTYLTYFGHYRCDTPDPPASTSVKTAGTTNKGEPKGKRGGAALMAAAIANATESPSGR